MMCYITQRRFGFVGVTLDFSEFLLHNCNCELCLRCLVEFLGACEEFLPPVSLSYLDRSFIFSKNISPHKISLSI
jgi:hypothetical protein